ncbi:hypothetical protein [Streptomyces sp. MAR4 CNX-425]|uniref:hypothetical protein n=1 Tax=Streptomyces sp. MAR4 CNX-425 TaxID=3406343 RepID=UPI003B513B26
MRRHRFEPAKLVAGLVLLCGALFGLLDAADALRQPNWVPLVVVPPGLALAALVAAVGYAARRARRRAREARAAGPRRAGAGTDPGTGPGADLGTDPGADLGALPMDELRGTYDARFGGPAGEADPEDVADGSGRTGGSGR